MTKFFLHFFIKKCILGIVLRRKWAFARFFYALRHNLPKRVFKTCICQKTANGGGAGIGSAVSSICGNISINGGTITATGGAYSAGIGSGNNGYCGDITIGNGITSVTATKGQYGWSPIGNGESGSCGTITIASNLNDVTDGNTRTLTPSSTPTAIDNTSINVKATKRIVNGQLLILRGEKTYTVTGQEEKWNIIVKLKVGEFCASLFFYKSRIGEKYRQYTAVFETPSRPRPSTPQKYPKDTPSILA